MSNLPILHLMVGLPGSGKTTEAIRLEQEHGAVRLTPDEWQYFLFGHDIESPDHDARHTAVERLMWQVAEKVLRAGVDVILDFGFWSKEERDLARSWAKSCGAEVKLHFMDLPLEVIWERVRLRNPSAGETAVFHVSKENLLEWSGWFEPPTKEELEQ